jgi:hypothetical protein
MTTTTTAETVDESAPTVRRLLQRQILPIDRDTDVFALYVDPEEPRLDAELARVDSHQAHGAQRALQTLVGEGGRNAVARDAVGGADPQQESTAVGLGRFALGAELIREGGDVLANVDQADVSHRRLDHAVVAQRVG